MFFDSPFNDLNSKIEQIESEIVRVYNVKNPCEHLSPPYKRFENGRNQDIEKLQERLLEYKIAIKALNEC